MKYLLIIITTLFSTTILAESNVEMHVEIRLNDKLIQTQLVETKLGLSQTVVAVNTLEVVLTPTNADGSVSIDAVLNKFEDGEFTSYKDAKVKLPYDETAYIVVGSEPIEVYEVRVLTKRI